MSKTGPVLSFSFDDDDDDDHDDGDDEPYSNAVRFV